MLELNKCLKKGDDNVQVLPMVGELKNVRLATEGSLFIQRLKIYSGV